MNREVDEHASGAARRPWWRLHLSTILLALPVAAVLAAAIVPMDDFHGDPDPSMGWPFVFLTPSQAELNAQRMGVRLTTPASMPPWLKSENWSPRPGMQISWRGLAADAGITLSVLLAWIVILEWRRRQRTRFWQFTLREGFFLMLVAVGIAAWLAHARRGRERERMAIEALTPYAQYAPACMAQRLLLRLVPAAWCGWFERAAIVNLQNATSTTRPDFPRGALTAFDHLESLYVTGNVVQPADLADCIRQNHLMFTDLTDVDLAPEELLAIFRCPSLQHAQVTGITVSEDTLDRLIGEGVARGQSFSHYFIKCPGLGPETADRLRARHPGAYVDWVPHLQALSWQHE